MCTPPTIQAQDLVQAGDCMHTVLQPLVCIMYLTRTMCSHSLERLPSLRPKRDLTLGGVPKVCACPLQMYWTALLTPLPLSLSLSLTSLLPIVHHLGHPSLLFRKRLYQLFQLEGSKRNPVMHPLLPLPPLQSHRGSWQETRRGRGGVAKGRGHDKERRL